MASNSAHVLGSRVANCLTTLQPLRLYLRKSDVIKLHYLTSIVGEYKMKACRCDTVSEIALRL